MESGPVTGACSLHAEMMGGIGSEKIIVEIRRQLDEYGAMNGSGIKRKFMGIVYI